MTIATILRTVLAKPPGHVRLTANSDLLEVCKGVELGLQGLFLAGTSFPEFYTGIFL